MYERYVDACAKSKVPRVPWFWLTPYDPANPELGFWDPLLRVVIAAHVYQLGFGEPEEHDELAEEEKERNEQEG